jgi:hypothetical protein
MDEGVCQRCEKKLFLKRGTKQQFSHLTLCLECFDVFITELDREGVSYETNVPTFHKVRLHNVTVPENAFERLVGFVNERTAKTCRLP